MHINTIRAAYFLGMTTSLIQAIAGPQVTAVIPTAAHWWPVHTSEPTPNPAPLPPNYYKPGTCNLFISQYRVSSQECPSPVDVQQYSQSTFDVTIFDSDGRLIGNETGAVPQPNPDHNLGTAQGFGLDSRLPKVLIVGIDPPVVGTCGYDVLAFGYGADTFRWDDKRCVFEDYEKTFGNERRGRCDFQCA